MFSVNAENNVKGLSDRFILTQDFLFTEPSASGGGSLNTTYHRKTGRFLSRPFFYAPAYVSCHMIREQPFYFINYLLLITFY